MVVLYGFAVATLIVASMLVLLALLVAGIWHMLKPLVSLVVAVLITAYRWLRKNKRPHK